MAKRIYRSAKPCCGQANSGPDMAALSKARSPALCDRQRKQLVQLKAAVLGLQLTTVDNALREGYTG
eukprot:2981361-Rhodomonas_salina.1